MRNYSHFLIVLLLLTACSGNSNPDKTDVIPAMDRTVQAGAPVVLGVREFAEKLQIPDVQLIDVRTDAEVEEGMIENAVQMNIADWDSFKESTATLDKSRPVLVYCKAGGRSAKAADYLSEQGFQVFDLKGGYSAWNLKH